MLNREQQQKLRKRAVELGNSGDSGAVSELLQLAESSSFHTCRLAVSGLGKLADVADAASVIPALVNKLRNPHAQVRQYAMKALMAYGAKAKCALPDLNDIINNYSETDYNRKQAQDSSIIIQRAIEVEEQQLERKCQKCSKIIDSGEYARSQKAFQRSYCDHCFDEVYLQRRNWDTKVELNKNIVADNGTLVQSKGEKEISNWLAACSITFRYDERIRIIEGYAVRPDFYLPEFDIYIEYWGMDTLDYKTGMLKKQKVYQLIGKKVISLYPKDIPNINYVLREKLSRYINLN